MKTKRKATANQGKIKASQKQTREEPRMNRGQNNHKPKEKLKANSHENNSKAKTRQGVTTENPRQANKI